MVDLVMPAHIGILFYITLAVAKVRLTALPSLASPADR